MSVCTKKVTIYSFDKIQEIASSFKATLDDDIINKLLEIKRNNKFITRRTPLRLKYQIQQSVATAWRKEREERETLSAKERFVNNLLSNLNKLSVKNFSIISEDCMKCYRIAIDEYIAEFKKNNPEMKEESKENADNWEDQFIETDIDCSEIDNEFLNTIFTKGMSEQNFSEVYAKLLQDICVKKVIKNMDIVSKIRELCDNFYDKNINELIQSVNSNVDYDELCQLFANKTKFVGGFVMISNLYKYRVLTFNIVKKYFNGLLEYTKHSPQEFIEKYLDTIITIIMSCGSELDKENNAEFKNNFMNPIIELKNNKNIVKQKFKFKFMDLIELYENNWIVDTEWTVNRKRK